MSPWGKSAPLPSRLGNVLQLLSRERKGAVFSDFSHGDRLFLAVAG